MNDLTPDEVGERATIAAFTAVVLAAVTLATLIVWLMNPSWTTVWVPVLAASGTAAAFLVAARLRRHANMGGTE
ncbi:hypothetical protein [Nonomuraea typhae]|uniref:hypothetical protein n=1 Tax=Nonomuraea typhae TaxID=2603600 RepID=UPI0012F90F9B|nr:hypothetical protein [Nonomuraea typhae]